MITRCPWCNRPAHVDDCHAKVMARRFLDEIAQLPPVPAPVRGPKTGRVVCRDCGDEVTLCLSGHVKHANGDRSHQPRSVAEQVAW